MAPKAASSSSLGPLAKRTFKGPTANGGASGSSSPSGSASSAPAYGPSSNSGIASPSRYPSSSPSRPSPQSRASSPPLLLPRHEETSLHRRLRSLLLDFTRQRTLWEEELLEMGEAVGAYASVLGELEEELAERGIRQGQRGGTKGKGKGRAVTVTSSAAQTQARNEVSPAITESFRSLHEIYTRSLLKGRDRIERATEGLVKLKDAARLLQVNWVRLDEEGGLGGEEGDGDVRWGRRGGDDFVDAIFHITLQAQIQTIELLQSLEVLLIECSPVGSLHSASLPTTTAISPSLSKKGSRRSKYDPATSSAKRKEVLLLWRDLPSLDRGGEGSFEWWKAVWRAEVRGWEEA